VGGTANKPTPITREGSRRDPAPGAGRRREAAPKVLFETGEAVRVKEGPFTDFHGNVEDVNYEKSKLRVSVTIFGRSTPVELDFSQVEKAYKAGAAVLNGESAPAGVRCTHHI
jgi:transcriptional antiterminator NusG